MNVTPARTVACYLIALCAFCSEARAQLFHEGPPSTVRTVVAQNIAIGAATAAVRAAFSGKDWKRPFLWGAAGGAVHVSGKLLSERNPTIGFAGLMVSGVGASMVGNASRGAWAFEEISVPAAFVRVRIRPREGGRVTLAMNATEAVFLAQLALQPSLYVDWPRTAKAGALVFATRRRYLVSDGDTVFGVAPLNAAVVSAYSPEPERTYRHEVVHIHQYHFVYEALARPMDDALHNFLDRRLRRPRWLEAGVAIWALDVIDGLLGDGDGPIGRWRELEARTLAR